MCSCVCEKKKVTEKNFLDSHPFTGNSLIFMHPHEQGRDDGMHEEQGPKREPSPLRCTRLNPKRPKKKKKAPPLN